MTTPTKIALSVLITIVVILGYGYWYNQNHYSSTYDTNFLSSCQGSGGSTDTCGCALGVIKANYTFSEAKSFDSYTPQYVLDKISSQCRS